MSKRRSTAAAAEPQENGVIPSTIPTASDAPPGARAARFLPHVDIDEIVESPLNPRKRFDDMEELTESIRQKGVLTPVLVRPVPAWDETPGKGGRKYELAAGHRRLRAARAAGVTAIPAMAREMDDAELLELLVVDNNQRKDVHPLEEAQGYQALLGLKGYDVARIAARVGRSVKYVYDRIKLLDLVPNAQKLFLEDRFTAGHAILLARLSAADQKRAIDVDEDGPGQYRTDGLWQHERGFEWQEGDDEKAGKDPLFQAKAVSVRELQSWIDRNVKADRASIEPILYPETAAYLDAQPSTVKVIPIMRLAQTPNAARGAERIYTESSWARADGAEGSKTCSFGEPGMIAIGPGRYEAFTICRKKDRCAVHWASHIKARKAATKAQASGKDPQKAMRDRFNREEEKRRLEREHDEAESKRWSKARPAILEAMAAAVRKAPTKATGLLAALVIEECGENYRNVSAAVEKLVPRGRTAEDLVRHAAMMVIEKQLHLWRARRDFPKVARAFGVDAKKIVDQAAPVEAPKVQMAARPVRGTCRKCGCQENTPCASGCGWADATQTRCTACFPPTLKSRAKKGGRR